MATIKKACKGTMAPKSSSVSSRLGSPSKAKSGTSLGMKSVKAGFDKNPGVTRADIIVAGKGQAKKGMKVKKAQGGKLQPMGNATKVGEGKYKSEDGNYKMKFKGGSEGSAPTKIVQRRTIKGLLSGAPRGAGNLNMKKGGKMGKCKYGCK
jgi:hypothetical protein